MYQRPSNQFCNYRNYSCPNNHKINSEESDDYLNVFFNFEFEKPFSLPWDIASVLSTSAVKLGVRGVFGIGIFVVVNLVVKIILGLDGNVVFLVVIIGNAVDGNDWERLLGTSLPLVQCLLKECNLNNFVNEGADLERKENCLMKMEYVFVVVN